MREHMSSGGEGRGDGEPTTMFHVQYCTSLGSRAQQTAAGGPNPAGASDLINKRFGTQPHPVV